MHISVKGETSTDDELLALATVFLGAWKSLNSKERLPLSDIVDLAEKAQNFNLAIYPESVNSKFEFKTFAIDEDRLENGEVLPGIGGMVYPRLGLGDITTKNSYIPEMVMNRM